MALLYIAIILHSTSLSAMIFRRYIYQFFANRRSACNIVIHQSITGHELARDKIEKGCLYFNKPHVILAQV